MQSSLFKNKLFESTVPSISHPKHLFWLQMYSGALPDGFSLKPSFFSFFPLPSGEEIIFLPHESFLPKVRMKIFCHPPQPACKTLPSWKTALHGLCLTHLCLFSLKLHFQHIFQRIFLILSSSFLQKPSTPGLCLCFFSCCFQIIHLQIIIQIIRFYIISSAK